MSMFCAPSAQVVHGSCPSDSTMDVRVAIKDEFGPRTRRVYEDVRGRIERGAWRPGDQLPPHLELAAEFGVAPMTVRQVLARLEAEGVISRQRGRGTFVRDRRVPAVLIIGDEPARNGPLLGVIRRGGLRTIVASGAADGLAVLADDPAVVLALVGHSPPVMGESAAFLRTAHDRWSDVPTAVMTPTLAALTDLYATPAWPLAIVPLPLDVGCLERLMHLVSHASLGATGLRLPHGLGTSAPPA